LEHYDICVAAPEHIQIARLAQQIADSALARQGKDANVIQMTRMAGRYLCTALLACAGLLISSCAAEKQPEVQARQLADEATQRVCDMLETCCLDANIPYQEQGCKSLYGPKILQHFSLQTFVGADLDAAAAQRCLDAIGQVGDGCPRDGGGYLTDACKWLFKGTVPLGGECDPGHGCATTRDAPLTCQRAYDERSGYEYSGVCIGGPSRVVHNGLGQACNQTCTSESGMCVRTGFADGPESLDGTCYLSDGLFCGKQSQQCERQSESGESCEGSMACPAGTYCDPDDSKCTPARPLGAPCADLTQCGRNYCIAGTCQYLPATAAWCAGKPATAPSSSPRMTGQ
jgi:hypothetical protein